MMIGKISPMARDRVERRDDTRLPTAWVGTNAKPSINGVDTPWLRYTDAAAAAHVERGPVLVMLDSAGAPSIGSLLTHAEAGKRVYVLSAINWDPSKVSPRLPSCPRVLFRRVPEPPVSGVITSGGAWLWLGDNAGAGNRWALQLDDEQTEAFRQIFLLQFWHRAIDEAWTGAHPPTFRPARERPFDVPELPRTAPVRLVAADASFDLNAPGALVHRTGGEPPAGPLRRLWIPPGGSHHDRLARLVRDGTEVLWSNRGLPDVVLGVQRGTMLVPGSGGRLKIELNRDQADAVARILEQPGVWRFETDVRLGDHAKGGHTTATERRGDGTSGRNRADHLLGSRARRASALGPR